MLVDVDDTLPSIFSSDSIGNYVAQRGGIGINAGELEALTPELEAVSPTHRVIPFLKKFESTVKCCTQNGVEAVVQRFTSICKTKK